MNCSPNKSIHCTVDKCKFNCKDEAYCTLSSVDIGTHEQNPTQTQCVDCNSFVPDNK
ncbi:MAG: DUF1540 domain-containing protein [Oscillospiraceae bacterium]|nr:DUF1540 domain-containing protein [Oscillospiraceae bacterium]